MSPRRGNRGSQKLNSSKAAHVGRGDKFRSVPLSRLFYYQPLANKRKSQLKGDGRRRDFDKALPEQTIRRH